MESDLAEIHTLQKNLKLLPWALCPGHFLFLFQPEQVPDRHAEVLGNLVGRCSIQILLAAVLQIGEDSSADTKIRAELAAGDTVFRAEGGNTDVKSSHRIY